MLPNDHHPGPRCSCDSCLRRFPVLRNPWTGRFVKPARCAALALLALPLVACMPDAIRIEVSHDSHSTVGSFHCSHDCNEDGLSTASVLAKWQRGPLTIEAGEGINLAGRNGGGFYGPREVFSARAGYEFRLKR